MIIEVAKAMGLESFVKGLENRAITTKNIRYAKNVWKFVDIKRVNYLVDRILDCYGICGYRRLDYSEFAENLRWLFRRSKFNEWETIAKGRIVYETTVNKIDINIARALAIVMASIVYYEKRKIKIKNK
jgi:hypothetical protein